MSEVSFPDGEPGALLVLAFLTFIEFVLNDIMLMAYVLISKCAK